jgi:hypothetical protein
MALDYILSQPTYSQTTQEYVLLLVHDGIAVYGCSTNTHVKILIGIDASETIRYDLRTTFMGLEMAYIAYSCNPFREEVHTDGRIKSPAFDKSIRRVVDACTPGR